MDPDHLCRAATRQGGNCNQLAGFGTNHLGVGRCKFHCGSTPDHQLAGVVELARREGTLNAVPIDITPYEALLECVRIAAGWVRFASEQIAAIQPAALVGGVTREHERPLKGEYGQESAGEMVTETVTEPGALHVWVSILQAWLDRLSKFSETALRANVEERMASVAERWEEQVAQLCQELARQLGHDPSAPDVKEAMRASLTLIAGGLAS